MKKIIYLLVLIVYLSSQDIINIYANNTNSKFSKFEKEIIQISIDLMKKRYGHNLKIQFHEIDHFASAFKLVNTDNEKNNTHNISINSISITEERKRLFDFSASYMPNKYIISSVKPLLEMKN